MSTVKLSRFSNIADSVTFGQIVRVQMQSMYAVASTGKISIKKSDNFSQHCN